MSPSLGNVFTPTMAEDTGVALVRRKTHQGMALVLYSILVGEATHYYVTVNHIVVCLTSLDNVAQYTFLRGAIKK